MREAIRRALFALLVEDPALLRLLAPHPQRPGAPALFAAARSAAPPALPCLTYRIASSVPDHRFRRCRQPLTGLAPKVESFFVEIETWVEEKGLQSLEDIRTRLDALLNDRALEIQGGRAFDVRRQTTISDQWDGVSRAYFEAARFVLMAERA